MADTTAHNHLMVLLAEEPQGTPGAHTLTQGSRPGWRGSLVIFRGTRTAKDRVRRREIATALNARRSTHDSTSVSVSAQAARLKANE